MSIETGCPPHEAVLDVDERLVCRLCGHVIHGGGGRTCLACVTNHEGWVAQHTCSRGAMRELLAFFFVVVAIVLAAIAGRLSL